VKCLLMSAAALVALTAPSNTPGWALYDTGVTARLRGLSAPSANVVWASGSEGTIIRTADGGRTWKRLTIPDTQKLDFRDIDAVDDRTAYVLSIGNGDVSRIYKTIDGGNTWTLQYRNEDPKAFYDAMAFRDERRGFAFSDSVDGQFVILRTENGGQTWTRVPAAVLPPALANEGAYAASGSNIAIVGNSVWIGTTASRVLRSSDGGRSWSVFQTPIPTSSSAGIFSMAFRDSTHGIVVGGDYKKESEAADNAALTTDGGRTWTKGHGLGGYRSAIAYVPTPGNSWIAVGPSGCDLSRDDGRSWGAVPGRGFDALSVPRGAGGIWASGEKGVVARLALEPGKAGGRNLHVFVDRFLHLADFDVLVRGMRDVK
jgi:photosystem II stability/assembly factor-like uncharacterized protein